MLVGSRTIRAQEKEGTTLPLSLSYMILNGGTTLITNRRLCLVCSETEAWGLTNRLLIWSTYCKTMTFKSLNDFSLLMPLLATSF